MRDQEQSAVWNGASQTGRFVKGDQIMEDQEQAVMTGASQTGASDVTEKDRTQSFASDAGNMSNWKKALDEKNGDSVPSAIREGETTAAERLGLKDADKSFTELADLENTRPAYDSLPNIGDKEQAELERHMNGASLLSADTVPIPTGSDEIGSDMFREKSLDELTSTMAGGVALDDNIARIPEDVMNELDMPDQKNNETLNALGNVDTDALARGMATGFTQTPLDIPRDIMPDSPQDITPGDETIASVLPKSAPERREEETMRSATQLGYSELRAIEIDDSRRAALQEVLNNQKLDTLYRDSIERDIAQGTITPREITRLMSEKDLDDATKQKLFKAFQNPSSPPPNIPPDILGNNSRPNT
jgi:hypothetical protein